MAMLQIVDGHPEIPMFLFHIQHARRCDDMLHWLRRNRLFGKRFMEWARSECSGSALNVVAEILRRLEKESERRPVLADDDYVINRRPIRLIK
jgi:hypothetical protein